MAGGGVGLCGCNGGVMLGPVINALGPALAPLALLLGVTCALGIDLVWSVLWGLVTPGGQAEAVAKLRRLGNTSMIVGVGGQLICVAGGLGMVVGATGASGVQELIRLLGHSLWATLAGISVALAADAFIHVALWARSPKRAPHAGS